ncbi:transposable element Tcb2 transposase [Trichonephila clavipes]|nr:transposable element Tcb2 transposase [Trichonephila clavipes]
MLVPPRWVTAPPGRRAPQFEKHWINAKRPRDERLNPAFALQRHTTPTAGVMVWSAIAYNTRSPLVLIRGTITANRYVRDIMQPHYYHPCNGSHEPFSTRQCSTKRGKGKTVCALLLPFLGLTDPQICLQ